MNVSLRIQIGLAGGSYQLNPIFLDVSTIGAAASWSGSYHVLAMGQHYDDYVIAGNLLTFPPIVGFPMAHPYQRLAGKIRATVVTGNIGESIAAIFAQRCLGSSIADIAHVKSRRASARRKAPDYMMRLVNVLPGPFASILPASFAPAWPTWMPVESKARTTPASSRSGRKEALKQLVTYWALLANSQPSAVGYGMIVSFTYQASKEVRANLFLPRNQTLLVEALKEHGENIEAEVLRDCLYGCQN